MRLLLVHGMARTALSLVPLALRLRRDGHDVALSGYIAALERFDVVCERVRRRLEAVAGAAEPYALIGHSLGGLILRIALDRASRLRRAPRRLIFLGTPNQPPRLARRYRHRWPYRVVNGEAGQLLADPAFYAALPPVRVPYVIVAGTGGSRSPRGRFGGEVNDGIVALAETLVRPDDSPILVPARHTFLMDHRASLAAIRRVLAEDAAR